MKPVGGVVTKIQSAMQAGVKKALIPRENDQELFREWKEIEVIPVDTIYDVFYHALGLVDEEKAKGAKQTAPSVKSAALSLLQAEPPEREARSEGTI